MAKLPRVTNKRFGADANINNVGQFGSAASGTKLNTKDVSLIQGLSAWLQGWTSATMSNNKYPTMQERNGVDYVHAYQIDYLLKSGIPEYDSQTEYNIGDIVKDIDNGEIVLYSSIINSNIGQALNNTLAWKEVQLGGSARNIGETVISLTPQTDAGLHLKDGTLLTYGSYQAFIDYIADLYDSGDYTSLFTTEANWQASNTAYGACDKFVYDDVNNTVRLPKRNSEHGELIKSGTSGNSWYRIYSDGYCEQGGIYYQGATSGSFSVVYPITFANAKYSLSVHSMSLGNTSTANETQRGATGRAGTVSTYSASGFTVPFATDDYTWYACGQVDVSAFQYTPKYEYIVISTTAKTAIEVDIDEIATDLNGKADVDLTNVSNGSGLRKLIQVYKNSGSWYKVFKEYDTSGNYIGLWCEQGGFYTTSTSGTATINFLKQFADTSYGVLCNKTSSDTSTWNVMFGSVEQWTTTSVPLKVNLTGYALVGTWYAFGYAKEN